MKTQTKRVLGIFMSVLMLMTCMSQLAFAQTQDLTDTLGADWSLEGDGNDLYTVAVENDVITLTAPEAQEPAEGEQPQPQPKSVLQYDFADKAEGKYTISTRVNLAKDGKYAFNVLDSDGNIVAGFGQVQEGGKRTLVRAGTEEKRIYSQANADWYNVSITVDMDADTVDFSINQESYAYEQVRILNGYFVRDEADANTISTQQSIPVEGGIKDIAVVQFDAPLNAWPMQIDGGVTVEEETITEEPTPEEPEDGLTAYGTATYDGTWDKTLQEIGFPATGYEILTTNASVNSLVSGSGTLSAATITTSNDATAGEIVDFIKTGTNKGATLAIKRDLSGLHADTDAVSVKTGFKTGADFTAASTSAGYLAEVASSKGIIAAIWANSSTGDILFKRQGGTETELLDYTSLIANTWYDVEYVLYGETGAMDLLISWPIPAESLADTDAYLAGLSLTATPAGTTVTPSAADGVATLKFAYTGSLSRIKNSLSDLYAIIGAYSDGGTSTGTPNAPSKMKVVTCTAVEPGGEGGEGGISVDSYYKLGSTAQFGVDKARYFTITNHGEEPTDVCVMMASYKANGTLVQISYKEYTDLIDSMKVGFGVTVDVGRLEPGDYFRAFIFDNLNNMKPLEESKMYTIPEPQAPEETPETEAN